MSSLIEQFESTQAEEDVKANKLQRIMQSASESESDDDDEESDEDEAKKPATSDKQKRSSRDKERRKNRRKLNSSLEDELSIVSTATEVQGYEMMIMKHVNFTVQVDRAVPRQGRSEQGEDRESTAVRCETHHRGKAAASPDASKNRCSCPAGASRRYGNQEGTVSENIENKTAEVGSISSDMASGCRQPGQVAQFLEKEIDSQNTKRRRSSSRHRDRCGSFSGAAGPTPTVPAAGLAVAVPDNIRSRAIS